MDATIIVVEDEPGTRATLCGILMEDAGYKVVGLERGAEALEMIRRSSFDVIIADIRLSDVSGLEILELAKEINPDATVIMMTGYASVETAVEAVNQGAYAYFVKPVNPDEMKTTIANALRQQRLSLENKRLVENLQRTNKLLLEANKELRNEITERKQAEEQHKIILRTALDGFWLTDLHGRLLEVNDSYCEMVGYTQEELLTMSIPDVEAMESSEETAKHIKNVMERGYDRFETRHKRKDGRIIDVEVSVNYLDVGEGRMFVFVRDITERKQVEEAVRESEERYRELADSLPQTVFETDEEGNITFINRQGLQTFGVTLEDIGRSPNTFEAYIPEDRARVSENIQKVLRGEELGGVEYTLLRKDGSTFPAIIYAAPIIREGKIVGSRGVTIDITERKRMEEALKESEERYRALLELGGEVGEAVIMVQDTEQREGIQTFVSDEWPRITGYSRKELLCMSFFDLVHPEHREASLKRHQRKMRGEIIPGLFEMAIIRKDGTEVPIELTSAYTTYQGKRANVAFIRDVTERKRMELELREKNEQLDAQNEELQSQAEELMTQQQELVEKTEEVERANQLKSEFLANMSHELRTPLNVVIGFSQLMVDEVPGEINEEQRQCLSDILGSSQHLLNLINEVLDLSKIESGRTELKLKNIALAEVIESLARTMMPILAPRKQNLDFEIEEGLPPVYADEGKLGQVLLNLVDNSSRFTPDGGKLKIEAVRKGDWCRVSVIDSGVGIKTEEQERIFEPFYRPDNPLTEERGSTGLGLAVVKQIIEKHGGRIWVESEYEKGSRLTFTLPLATSS